MLRVLGVQGQPSNTDQEEQKTATSSEMRVRIEKRAFIQTFDSGSVRDLFEWQCGSGFGRFHVEWNQCVAIRPGKARRPLEPLINKRTKSTNRFLI